MALDMDKLNAFVGRFVVDLGATIHAGMVVLGDKLGLYKALATQPMTPAEQRPAPMRATSANGWAPRQPVVSSPTTPAISSSA